MCVAFVVGAVIGAGADLAAQALGNVANGCGAFDNISWGEVGGAALIGGGLSGAGALVATGGVAGKGGAALARLRARMPSGDSGAIRIGRNSDDQVALIRLAKDAKRTGVSDTDARTLLDWADEVGLAGRGPEIHPNRSTVNFPHIHIGPVGHIPVF